VYKLLPLFSAIVFAVLASAAHSAPSNDAFASGQIMGAGLPANFSGDAVGATVETFEPLRDTTILETVWFRWTPTSSGTVAIRWSWDGSNGYGTDFTVYTGTTLTNLQAVAVGDDINGVKFAYTAGTTYRIQAQVSIDPIVPAPYTITLAASPTTTPANDSFASATIIPSANTGYASSGATTNGATTENGEIFSTAGTASIWFKWTPSASATRAVSVNSTALSAYVEVFQGTTLSGLQRLGWAGAGINRFFSYASGSTYYFRVSTNAETAAVALRLPSVATVPVPAPPANDAFISASPVLTTGTVVNSTTVGGTVQTGEQFPFDLCCSVWHKFTATTAGWYLLTPDSTVAQTPYFAVWKNVGPSVSLANLRMVGMGDASSANTVAFFLDAGETAYLQFGSWDGDTGPINFTIDPAADPGTPRVTNIAWSPATANVTAGTASVEVSLTVAGPATSTVSSFSLMHPGGGVVLGTNVLEGGFTTQPGVGGSTIFRATIQLPQGIAPGSYPAIVVVGDTASAAQIYYGSTAALNQPYLVYGQWGYWSVDADIWAGQQSLTVTDTAVPADTPPTPSGFAITPATIDASGANVTVTFTVTLADPLGVNLAWISLPSDSGLTATETVPLSRTGGTAANGTWSGTLLVPRYSAPSARSLTLYAVDTAGQSRRFGHDDQAYTIYDGVVQSLGSGPARLVITNSGLIDRLPPQVRAVTLTPNPLTAGGSTLLSARIVDDLSGVSGAVLATFDTLGDVLLTRISGTANDGVYEGTLSVPITTPAGNQAWSLAVNDAFGHSGNFESSLHPWLPGLQVTAAPPSYALWAATLDLVEGANGDDDNDGIPNVVELVLSLNPLVPGTAQQTLQLTPTLAVFTFYRDDASETNDISLAFETGVTPGIWTGTFTIGTNTAGSSPGVVITENGTDPDKIEIAVPLPPEGALFGRLKVTVAP
jgi:hypothetical protein